ncbi:MAG TPA: VOC family protein [Caulobacteraceae bacterium]|jgi:catechol 2,3-dioxygenase-like lactoylglutathione lyase family enzyme|nr:VOC family protein [Caulobacteraceae bacterium]
MLDHIGLTVSDFAKAKAFYDQALAPLGIAPLVGVTAEQSGGGEHAGYGSAGRPYFWIGTGPQEPGAAHVAFTTDRRATVEAFYEAALAAGGRDNGAPGVRAHYHPNYYGAFVLDPDGHNIEAVCHGPE